MVRLADDKSPLGGGEFPEACPAKALLNNESIKIASDPASFFGKSEYTTNCIRLIVCKAVLLTLPVFTTVLPKFVRFLSDIHSEFIELRCVDCAFAWY